MSEGIQEGQVIVAAPVGAVDDLLIESKVDEIKENKLGLESLKCAIEAIGEAMAELAETSAVRPELTDVVEGEQKKEEIQTDVNVQPAEASKEGQSEEQVTSAETTVNEEKVEGSTSESVPIVDESKQEEPVVDQPQQEEGKVEANTDEPVAVDADQQVDQHEQSETTVDEPIIVVVEEKEVIEVSNEPTAQSSNEGTNEMTMDAPPPPESEETEPKTDAKLDEDKCETGFETALYEAMSLHSDGTQTEQTTLLETKTGLIPLAEGEMQSIDFEEYEEIEVEEEVEVDDDDATSQVTQGSQGEEKPKKKKKLRILKKIRRAPGKIAYGALFTVGAMVGGSIVGGQAVGHGAKTGAVKVADTTGKIAEGTRDLAKSAASKVADGARAGGDFVVETADKIAEETKDTAMSFVKATAGAVGDTANAALYGAGAVVGGTMAVGHGMVVGTKAVGHGVVGGTKAIGHGVVDGTKAIGHGVVDGTKASAKFISDTTNKVADHIEEKAREALVNAVEATSAGAQFAGYGKQQGNPLAIEADKKSIKSNK